MSAPDKSTLWCDDRAGEFEVVISVRASVRETVTAESAEDARAQVAARIDDENLEVYASDIEEADIDYVTPCQPMYLVEREGRLLGVSHPIAGDKARPPAHSYEEALYKAPSTGGDA